VPKIWDKTDWGRDVGHEFTGIAADEVSDCGQRIVIAQTVRFGDMLFLGDPNGDLSPQFAWADEYKYHQALVWIPFLYHDNPEEVHIYGGGDLLAAWRATLGKSVRRVRVLDWDLEVKHLALEHMAWVQRLGVHQNPNVDSSREVDVREHLKDPNVPQVPIIIWDLTDIGLISDFTPNALDLLYAKLAEGGIAAIQGGEYSDNKVPLAQILANYRALRERFATVLIGHTYIGSFNYEICIFYAFKGRGISPMRPALKELNERIRMDEDRTFLTPRIHNRLFIHDPSIEMALCGAGLR